MIVQISQEWVNFHTNFNAQYKMVHSFISNLGGSVNLKNGEFDFFSSGLVSLDSAAPKRINLSSSSDAVPAFSINGAYIGANHGQPCCVNVYSTNHGKTLKDVGAVYKDELGVKFTLLRIINADYLTFISENIGKSQTNYQFKLSIDGNLSYLSDGNDTADIIVIEQTQRVFLMRAIKHEYKDVFIYNNGIKRRIISGSHECDYGELHESYSIINPATVAPALTANRPTGGYEHEPNLCDFGTPMLNLKQVFSVLPDSTILVDFEVKKYQDVRTGGYMGVMYQEMENVFGGGIHRTLPKIKPFTTPEGYFDYSSPLPLRGAYPANFSPDKNYNTNPDFPFDRMVDYFRDNDGNDRLGFACGYLPLHDGEPNIRKNHLNENIFLWHTRKAYPYFTSGSLSHYRGIAYKKFFDTANRASVYSVEHEGKKYIYFNFFEKNTLSFPVSGKVSLYEAEGVDYEIKDGLITATSNKGYATFIEEI